MGRSASTKREPDEPTEASEETPLLFEPGPSSSSQTPPPQYEKPVSWASIPNKGQLAVLVFARLAEPLSERSLTSYLFFQLRWFDPSLGAAEIATQAGYITAVFAAAQCLTSMWWGRAADDPRLGRKRVLLIGLMGTTLSALGMGFATSLRAAFFFRFLAGALNGNVGVLRTMVSEIVVDKRHKTRAFLLLPMCFNIGVIIGPLLSGFLADPIRTLPGIFGPGSFLGGADGVAWMRSFPYALPNLFFAVTLASAALGIVLGLDETHPQLRHQRDRGRELGRLLLSMVRGQGAKDGFHSNRLLANDGDSAEPLIPRLLEDDPEEGLPEEPVAKQTDPAPLPSIWTRKVILNMGQRFLQSLHVSAFNSIFFSLLPVPQADGRDFHLPFRFSGGLGLSSKKMGLANTTIGMIGIPLQLLVYPRMIGHLGVKSSYQIFLPIGIVAYFLVPYLVLLPAEKAGLVWTCLSAVLSMQVLSRTFVNPATVMLVNDCAPSPDRLGTIHGLAQSISSAARIMGPTMGGTVLGWGLGHNFVGLPLWLLAIIAVANWLVVMGIEDVNMHH
ncbi:major facilitator superfamily transporter [Plectosphaerella plurivora]|uniref:Major facilitator superfamily transporter n=1 Tax=Plectosphaerella plurivora TaxID=936078 RepID=A0A9P9A4W0_9PEZI|nr:major facilitator superfamily transporter [Plectosphaerella plurivora]